MTYAIARKSDKKFFLGFDDNGFPIFGDKTYAKIYTREIEAKTQAAFLVNCDRNVQRKPVII